MKISGFTYIRNGFTYQYPFLESISSVLPIVDEMIVVVGDSNDGTREAIVNLNNQKINIIDSIWDQESRTNGTIFAAQTNIGLQKTSGDWALHIQADEVLHESAKDSIIKFMKTADTMPNIDGLLFPYYHFWGDYHHIRNTRRTHPFEIRAFKNKGNVFSYHDSQGFRIYTSFEAYQNGEKGKKLQVLNTNVPIYHYSYSRNPKLMQKKSNYFHRFWHNDEWLQNNINNLQIEFDYNNVDRLEIFKGNHPIFMQDFLKKQDWEFVYDPTKSNMSFKDKLLYLIEVKTQKRLFSYKNYILAK